MMDAKCKISKTPTIWPCEAIWCPLYHDCLQEYKKMAQNYTNADRIRAMSDEEMAGYILSDLPIYRTYKRMLEWLQQPAQKEGEQNV